MKSMKSMKFHSHKSFKRCLNETLDNKIGELFEVLSERFEQIGLSVKTIKHYNTKRRTVDVLVSCPVSNNEKIEISLHIRTGIYYGITIDFPEQKDCDPRVFIAFSNCMTNLTSIEFYICRDCHKWFEFF